MSAINNIRVNLGNKTLVIVGARATELGLDSADEAACEKIFEMTNAGSPKNVREWVCGGYSSMSVGDAIWFQETAEVWFCDSAGFRKMTDAEVAIYKTLHPIDRSISGWKAVKAGGNSPSLAEHRAEYDYHQQSVAMRESKMDQGNKAEADLARYETRLFKLQEMGVKVA